MKGTAFRIGALGALLAVAAFLLPAPGAGAQSAAAPGGGGAAEKGGAVPGPAAERPLLESWQETLRFGIDLEVLAALKAIEEAGERSLDRALTDLFTDSASRELRVAILDYFSRLEYAGAGEAALRLLDGTEDQNLTVALIHYLQATRAVAALPLLRERVGRTEGGIARAAVQALGRLGGEAEADLLLKHFDDPEYPADLKSDLILALGDLRQPAAVEPLVRIAGNPDEEKMRRMYAADALGRIGDPRAVPVLEELFCADDALLRAYAASALGKFDREEVRRLLVQGLRDSNVRVRISAAKSLGSLRAKEAVEILEYKVARDPEPQMRLQAIQALGEIGSGGALEFLEKLLLDEKEALPSRSAALESLIGNEPGRVLGPLRALVDQQWAGKNPRLLQYAAQKMSQMKEPRLRETFLRFLDSKDYLLRIYGIRGLAASGAGERGRIEQLSRDDPHPAVRRTAELILSRP